MAFGTDWTRDELLLALRIYLGTEFGRLHGRNPQIIQVARAIERTPNAVAMKTTQFANLDPDLDRKGLSNTSQADREIWAEFTANPEQIAYEAETVAESLNLADGAERAPIPHRSDSPQLADDSLREESVAARQRTTDSTDSTDSEAVVRVRRVQSFFRAAILTSYESRCAMTGLAMPSLLVASHIIPWSDDVSRRADPRNGLCLSALFDRAFDRGLITFDEDFRLLLSPMLEEYLPQPRLPCTLSAAKGERLKLPVRLTPDPEALAYHRESVFLR